MSGIRFVLTFIQLHYIQCSKEFGDKYIASNNE